MNETCMLNFCHLFQQSQFSACFFTPSQFIFTMFVYFSQYFVTQNILVKSSSLCYRMLHSSKNPTTLNNEENKVRFWRNTERFKLDKSKVAPYQKMNIFWLRPYLIWCFFRKKN